MPVPWLSSAYLVEQTEKKTEFPFTLPFVRTLDVALDDRITVFAGETAAASRR